MEENLKVKKEDQDVEPSLPFNHSKSVFEPDHEIRMTDDSDGDESSKEETVSIVPIVIREEKSSLFKPKETKKRTKLVLNENPDL